MKKNVNVQAESVNKVINLINVEAQSLGAVVRSFIAVADSDEFAAYMLRTICKHETPAISLTVNEIKKRVIIAYPYKDNDNTLLQKDGGLYVPVTKYTGQIIKRAFYNIVTPKENVSFEAATEEQIKEHTKAKEEKREQAKAKREQEKKQAEDYKAFYERLMSAESKEIAWAIILEAKTAK